MPSTPEATFPISSAAKNKPPAEPGVVIRRLRFFGDRRQAIGVATAELFEFHG